MLCADVRVCEVLGVLFMIRCAYCRNALLLVRALAMSACIAAVLLILHGEVGAALINPLAYNPLGSFDVGLGSSVTIDTTLGEIRVNGVLAFTGVIDNQSGAANTAAGIPELAVFSFDEINIRSGVAVTITGSRGLALLSREDVTIRSAISVNGGDYGAASPAGGFAGGGAGSPPTAPGGNGGGPGGGHSSTIGWYAGAGGGGYGGAGGQGGGYTAADSLGGNSYPPIGALAGSLYGGSGGAAGQNGDSYGLGGGGGGVLEISALGQVKLLAPVTSKGGRAGMAVNSYGGGGGGSGGSIRIAGQTVTLGPSGLVSANGSDGGAAFGGGGGTAGGGGGGGRVLIQQNGVALAGVTASGGAAIGAAQPGADGTVEQLVTTVDAGTLALNVRIGTGSASGLTTIARGGNINGALYGLIDHVGAGFTGPTEGTPFSFAPGIGGIAVQLVPVTYATNSRTTETVTVHSNGGDRALAVGRGVGPTFATNMGVHANTTINLGSTKVGQDSVFHLIVNNASTDLGSDSPLTSLGILGVNISGPDAAAFSVDNLIPSTLFEQQFANLPIHFEPTELRSYSATLTIQTDQGAANGALGQAFTYQLFGGGIVKVTLPEPTTALLAGVGAMMMAVGRRRE